MGRKNTTNARGGRSIEEAFYKAGASQQHSSQPPQPSAPPLLLQPRYRSRSRSRDPTRDHSRDSSGSMDSTERGIAPLPAAPPLESSHTVLLQHFTTILHSALQAQSKQMRADFRKDMRILCDRTQALEIQSEALQSGLKETADDVSMLKEENDALQAKIEDLENRSRRSNLRFRGIPEQITNVDDFITRLCQDLLPEAPIARLELERAHRALTRKNPSGPPRDIVVKFLYFKTKEAVLMATRNRAKVGPLSFSGHQYQVFNDLAPSTIQKRKEMKPAISILQSHGILYKWGFPFRLIFQYHGKYHAVTSPAAAQDLLRTLGLTSPAVPTKSADSSPAATKRPRSPRNRLDEDVPCSPDGKQPHRRED